MGRNAQDKPLALKGTIALDAGSGRNGQTHDPRDQLGDRQSVFAHSFDMKLDAFAKQFFRLLEG